MSRSLLFPVLVISDIGHSVFQLGLVNGGPSGLIYGFLIAWAGTALQALVMGEMASMSVATSTESNF